MTANAERSPIERIFERLAATYVSAWDRSIGVTPMIDVKTAWAHELSGFLQSRATMKRIAWALENLPERCPNVIEFKNLCRSAPSAEVAELPAPKADPERVKAELAKLAPIRAAAAAMPTDRLDWAKRIIANPQGRTPTVVKMARDALSFV